MSSRTLKLEGILPALEEDTAAGEDLDERALAYIRERGMELPPQPMKDGKPFVPRIPTGANGPTMDGLDDRGVSNLCAQLLAYYQYCAAELSRLEIKKLGLSEQLANKEARIKLLLPPPESSKKDRVLSDKRVKKIRDTLLLVKAKTILVTRIVDCADKEMKTASREVTIRQNEKDFAKTENNLGRRRRRPDGIPGGRQVG